MRDDPTVRSPPPTPVIDLRIAAAARGDRRAAEGLLAELLPRVRNLVRYLIRGDADVDDLAQEALIAILRGLPSFRGEGTFQSWSDRVVVRSTLAARKRSRRDRAQLSTLAPTEQAPAPARRVDDEYAARREMVRLLEQLPDEQRIALVLHHVVGLSVPEIAEQLGVPFETTRSRLRLGKATLIRLHGDVHATGEVR